MGIVCSKGRLMTRSSSRDGPIGVVAKGEWRTSSTVWLSRSAPAAAISVADIVEAVEGPIALTACVEGQDCTIGQDCSLRPHWPLINGALRGALAGIALTQLADAPKPHAPKELA